MNTQRNAAVGVAIILGILILMGSGAVLAGEPTGAEWKKNLPFDLTGEVEAGLQVVQPQGNSPTFDEYRDLDRTDAGGWGHLFQVPSLRLLGEDKARTRFLEIGGTDLTRMDANYYLNTGLYNYLRFNFEYDRIPHVIAHNARTIYVESEQGIFKIPASGAPALAAALNAVGSPPTPAQRTAVETAVNALLRPTELGFQTDAARFGMNWLPMPELELMVNYSFTNRDGHVPSGFVIGSPGSGVVELAAPRKEQFHELKAGAEYVRDWYQFRFNYTYSLYQDDVNKIEWDGPCGAGAGGCRNTSGFGRASAMPENYAHTFSGAAGFNLPWWKTRLTGGASYSQWRQNETFLPWTTIAGFSGNTTDAGASSPDAKMNVVHANVNLTTRPLRDVTANFRYRYFDLDNDTPMHTFTNVLSGGGDTTPGATVHESEPLAFRKQNASADVAWRIISQVTAKVGYEWEQWNRDHREVDNSNEHAVKAAVDVRPWHWLLGRVSYAHSVRTIGADGYDPLGGNATSLPQFRKFDEADRTRDKVDVLLQISPLDTLTLAGSFYGQNDEYFNTSYGLQDAKAFGWSADVTWAPVEQVSFFAGYGHDEYKSKEQSCNISVAPPTPCNPLDTFFVNPRDILDSVTTGVNLVIIPKRLDLSLGYRFSFGRSKQSVGGVPGGAAAGEPAPVPTTENQFHVLNAVTSFHLTPQWTLKLGYQYERYNEKDFTSDGVSPSLANFTTNTSAADVRSIVLGAQHPPYEAHIVAFSVAYKF